MFFDEFDEYILLGSTGLLGSAVKAVLPTGRTVCPGRNVEDIRFGKGCKLVINCAGITSNERCKVDYDEALAANVVMPHSLATKLTPNDHLIHISSNYALVNYTQNIEIFTEDALPATSHHISKYGRTKALAELWLARFPNVSIVRVQNLYSGKTNKYLDSFIKQALFGEVKASNYHRLVPTNVEYVVKGLRFCSSPGVYHLTPPIDLSVSAPTYYQLAATTLTLMGLDSSRVKIDNGGYYDSVPRSGMLSSELTRAILGMPSYFTYPTPLVKEMRDYLASLSLLDEQVYRERYEGGNNALVNTWL